MRYWETPQKFLKYFPFPILVLTGAQCPFRPYAWANSYSKDYLCTLFMLRVWELVKMLLVLLSESHKHFKHWAGSSLRGLNAFCLFPSSKTYTGEGAGEEREYCRSQEKEALHSDPLLQLCVFYLLFFVNVKPITRLGSKDRAVVSHLWCQSN